MQEPVRVLIVDDSAFMRLVLSKYLDADPGVTVVGKAHDGLDALGQIPALKPDVVTLNVEMPRMDGLTALKRIMVKCPTPVIMVSAFTHRGARATIQALMRGAVDFVAKPSTDVDVHSVAKELTAKVKIAADTRSPQSHPTPLPTRSPVLTPTPFSHVSKSPPRSSRQGNLLIIIGASTGGPRALQRTLSALPADLPAAVVVVQHMPAEFTGALAQRLDERSPLTVREAADGDSLARGVALLAPGNFHLQIDSNRRISLNQEPRLNGVRPAVDVTMQSAATHCGAAVIGVVLTGMGSDGTAGARHIRAAGGKVLVEHESTSTVYGMPRSVIEAGLADRVSPLPEMASTLIEWVK
ncbi:MAG: chemotaxis response regulator protein-glutamate methylesterase [Chloroflexi bacterium]|nr:chemotaxis response regulator protein-glutamate methylesterase [Chloroflexota bacterium]